MAGLLLLGLAAAPVFPLLTLNTAARTGARAATRTVTLQVAASAAGGAAVPAGLGLVLGAGGAAAWPRCWPDSAWPCAAWAGRCGTAGPRGASDNRFPGADLDGIVLGILAVPCGGNHDGSGPARHAGIGFGSSRCARGATAARISSP